MKKLLNVFLSVCLLSTSCPNVYAQGKPASKWTTANVDAYLKKKIQDDLIQRQDSPLALPKNLPMPPKQQEAVTLSFAILKYFNPEIAKLYTTQSIIPAGTQKAAANNSGKISAADAKAMAISDINKNKDALFALYKTVPVAAAPSLLEVGPVLWGYPQFLTAQQKEILLTLYRKTLSNYSACTNNCRAQLNAVLGLSKAGVLGEDSALIFSFTRLNLKTPYGAQILLGGVAGLLAMKDYSDIRQLINLATAEERKAESGDIDLFSIVSYVNGLAVIRGQYLGKISKFAQYPIDDKHTGNVWTDIAVMLAAEGSGSSLSILKEFGVDQCRVTNVLQADMKYSYQVDCRGILPFLAGALVSGKSGAEGYAPSSLVKPQSIVYATGDYGAAYIPDDKDIAYSERQSKGSVFNLKDFAAKQGVSKAAVFAESIMNAGMGDLSADDEYMLDRSLLDAFPQIEKYKSAYAVVDAASYAAKVARRERYEVCKKVAVAADIAFYAWCAYGLGKLAVGAVRGFGALGKEIYEGIRVSRLGETKLGSLAFGSSAGGDFGAYRAIAESKNLRSAAKANLAKTLADEGVISAVKLPEPAVQETLYYASDIGKFVLAKGEEASYETFKFLFDKELRALRSDILRERAYRNPVLRNEINQRVDEIKRAFNLFKNKYAKDPFIARADKDLTNIAGVHVPELKPYIAPPNAQEHRKVFNRKTFSYSQNNYAMPFMTGLKEPMPSQYKEVFQGRRVIYITDDTEGAELIRARLKADFGAFDIAFTKEDGVKMLSQKHYDLAIIDMNFYKLNPNYAPRTSYVAMYSMDDLNKYVLDYSAFEVLSEIRAAKITTPAVCASSETVSSKTLYDGGFDGFVLFPESQDLIQTVTKRNLYYWMRNNKDLF